MLEAEDVAASLGAVLGKDGRDGLEHALRNEVWVVACCLPFVDKLLVTCDNVLVDLGIVLEVHRKPDVTVRLSVRESDYKRVPQHTGSQ